MLDLKAGTISKGFVKDIIIVGVGVAIIWISLTILFGTTNPFYVVSSGSMVPVLEVYDVLVVQGNHPFEDIKIGDIIVFNRPSGHDRVIVHRVAAIIDDDPFTIRTKGDANPSSIPGTDFPITEEEYIGIVEYVIPQVGFVTQVLTPPINYIIIAIIIGVMIFKQMAKSKSEKELGFTDPFDPSKSKEKKDNKKETESKTKELKDFPKDKEYSKEDQSKESTEKSSGDTKKSDNEDGG